MPSVLKSVLVQHTAEQMFDLVTRIENYPNFLPWCAGTKILGRTEDGVMARIDIDYHGVRAHFTTANRNFSPDRIVIELRDGPFRKLDGTWRFIPLAADACKVEFNLQYEFATSVLAAVIGPVFGHIASTFIDAFVKRADQIHGAGPAT